MYSNMNNNCMRPVVPEMYPIETGNVYDESMPIYEDYMPIYHEPMMPQPHMPHMHCPCRCPLMMDPNFRRCMQICMRQHECGNHMYGEIPMNLEPQYEAEEEVEKE